MLSRAASDAGLRVRRAKSTSTVSSRSRQSTSEDFDQAVARQQAVAAARSAFGQAYALETLNTPSTIRKSHSRSKFPSSANSPGPRLRTTMRSSETSGRSSMSRQNSTAKMVSRNTSLAERESFPNPKAVNLNRASSRPQMLPDRTTTPAEQTPKSVRKARSLLTTFPNLGVLSDQKKSSPQPGLFRSRLPCYNDMSEAGSSPSGITYSPPQVYLSRDTDDLKTGDEVVSLAQDRYLQDLENQRRLRHKPSFVMSSLQRLHVKVRKATSDAAPVEPSTNTIVTIGTEVQTPSPPKGSLRKRTSMSGTFLKEKLRKAVRKSSGSPGSLPVQQLNASRSYFSIKSKTKSAVPPPASSDENHNLNPANLSLSESRASSGQAESTPNPSLAPQSKSPTSRSSECGSDGTLPKSRVSSWSTTSIGGTTSSKKSQRLSVINENEGANAVNPSRRPSKLFNANKLFQNPLRRGSGHTDNENIVNTVELFSALRDEMDRSELENGRGVTAMATPPGNSRESLPSQRRLASLTTGSTTMKRTIRKVPREPKRVAGVRSPSQSTVVTPQIRKVNSRSASAQSESGGSDISESGSRIGDQSQPFIPRIRPVQQPLQVAPSPAQISSRVRLSDSRWKTTLEDDTSRFFPGTPHSRGRRKNQYDVHNEAALESVKEPDPTRLDKVTTRSLEEVSRSFHDGAIPDRSAVISPSVYSRATDQSPNKTMHTLSSNHSDSEDHGRALVSSSRSIIKYELDSPAKQRASIDSTIEDHDWKSWLSSEIADHIIVPKHDVSPQSYAPYGMSGHHREQAQILDPDPSEASQPAVRRLPAVPLLSSIGAEHPGRPPTLHPISDRRFSVGYNPAPNSTSDHSPDGDVFSDPARPHPITSTSTARRAVPTPWELLKSNASSPSYNSPTPPEILQQQPSLPRIRPSSSTRFQRLSGAYHQSQTHRPHSALDLRRPFPTRRTAFAHPSADVLLGLDDTLKRISQGPYAHASASHLNAGGAENKENVPGGGVVVGGNGGRFGDGGSRERMPTLLPATPTSGHRMADVFLSSRGGTGSLGEGIRGATESPVFL